MNRLELDFDRPDNLQARRPPEARGLKRDEVRLLVSTSDGHEHARFVDLSGFLAPGTLLVVNRSKTLAASLPAQHADIGVFIVNVSTYFGGRLYLVEPRWSAAEPGPLPVGESDVINVAGLEAELIAPYPGLPRLWFIRVDGNLGDAMDRAGEPIRYAYLEPPYPLLSAYQTLFGQTPGSAEMPSAARPFTPRVVEALRAKGVQVAGVTLHTGVSSLEIEVEEIEAQVLIPEPFSVPTRTAEAVTEARREGRPVVAAGTTVVRALESAWDGKRVRPASGFTRLFVHPGRPVQSVDGIITGLHDPMASHLAMLYALSPKELVRESYAEAVREEYLWHEFGDSHLLLPRPAASKVRGRPVKRGEQRSRAREEGSRRGAGSDRRLRTRHAPANEQTNRA